MFSKIRQWLLKNADRFRLKVFVNAIYKQKKKKNFSDNKGRKKKLIVFPKKKKLETIN